MLTYILKVISYIIGIHIALLYSTVINASLTPKVTVGIDVLFNNSDYIPILKNKKIGLITNHTAINRQMLPTREVLKSHATTYNYTLSALFAPEHGITGAAYESESITDGKDLDGIPVFSLYGKTRRPTPDMLKHIDILIYDIQDIGSRSYTYISTLFYAMEEAAKLGIPVIVLDRPNPINGLVVDGPMLNDKWRSIVGYINVPYCHGMTIGELASFFNGEYQINCKLTVIPMKGWKRAMSFHETGLTWVPTSPNIPEPTTAAYYPVTGLLGELQIVSIGVGYTLPFKLVGAPWINAEAFAKNLNAQKFPGVSFLPFHFRPFHGRFAQENCQGVQIVITDQKCYKPVGTQYLIIGVLKNMYPQKMKASLIEAESRRDMFCKVNGTEEVYRIMTELDHVIWPLRSLHQKEREAFMIKRKKYLIASY